ncbi:MAG TPA: hypothetical protein VGW40_05755 [Allosphingosinicella sp.]|nr:hypothetical protein [Allosphingosinicella sp.]
MHDDNFDALFEGKKPDEEAPKDEMTPEVETVEEAEETEEVADEKVEQTPSAAADDDLDEEAKRVPLAALIDTRLKLKERERELEELRKSQQVQQQSEAVKAPDPYDDPAGFEAYQQTVFRQALIQQKLEMSKVIAEQKHGADPVEKAIQWAREKAATDPSFEPSVIAQAHPVEWVVQQHQRHALLSQIEADPDAFVLRRAAELGLISASQTDASATASTTQPLAVVEKNKAPKSLANIGSVSDRANERGEVESFNAIFDKK